MEYPDAVRGVGIKCGFMIRAQSIEQLVEVNKQLKESFNQLKSGNKKAILGYPPLIQGIYKNILSQFIEQESIGQCIEYISDEVIKKKIGILLFKDVIQKWLYSGKDNNYLLKVKEQASEATTDLEKIVGNSTADISSGIKKLDFSNYKPEVREAFSIIESCSESINDVKMYVERLFAGVKEKRF